jgi:addiction module HigA family antidote
MSELTPGEILLDRRSISPEMSLKLGKFFKQSAQFWFNMQTTCDFRQLRKKKKITAAVTKD